MPWRLQLQVFGQSYASGWFSICDPFLYRWFQDNSSTDMESLVTISSTTKLSHLIELRAHERVLDSGAWSLSHTQFSYCSREDKSWIRLVFEQWSQRTKMPTALRFVGEPTALSLFWWFISLKIGLRLLRLDILSPTMLKVSSCLAMAWASFSSVLLNLCTASIREHGQSLNKVSFLLERLRPRSCRVTFCIIHMNHCGVLESVFLYSCTGC